MTRHEFLAALHKLVKPKTYLEIGVQYGASLALAGADCKAVAVDPDPKVHFPITAETLLFQGSSDSFFASRTDLLAGKPVDLAFIDGMHLAEFALRDFMGVERLSHAGTVAVFDDVLPRNRTEASRISNPGDWAGDVWKIAYILQAYRPDLTLTLVDVAPTGVLVVTGLNKASDVLARRYAEIETTYINGLEWMTARDDVLNRVGAVKAEQALIRLGAVAHA